MQQFTSHENCLLHCVWLRSVLPCTQCHTWVLHTKSSMPSLLNLILELFSVCWHHKYCKDFDLLEILIIFAEPCGYKKRFCRALASYENDKKHISSQGWDTILHIFFYPKCIYLLIIDLKDISWILSLRHRNKQTYSTVREKGDSFIPKTLQPV